MRRGLVIGKFYPPHLGHKHLINTARDDVDQLTVIVCGKADQVIPSKLRAAWLQHIHPDITVKVIESSDDTLPEDDSRAWAEATKQWLGYTPDVVFTSEDYGDAYTKHLGCEHVCVDKSRVTVPISGTQVRQAPLKHLNFLEPIVRAHFVKRVCVIGAESTGTSTLANALGQYFGAAVVPEYGREYTKKKYTDYGHDYAWEDKDFQIIAAKQNTLEDSLAETTNELLVCDTNSWLTNVYHDFYMSQKSPHIKKLSDGRHYDLYILTDIDIPFQQDGFRKESVSRTKMHQAFIELLGKEKKPYIIVSGEHEQRLKTAIAAVSELLLS